MPAIIQLQSLQDITLALVFDWLLNCLENVKTSKKTLQFRNYVKEHLSSRIKQDLLNRALNVHMHHLSIESKCSLFETISDNSTTKVDFSQSGELFVEEVFTIYRLLSFLPLNNLEKLGISCKVPQKERKYIAEINSTIYSPIKQMKNLRWVTLTSVGDSELLEVLGYSCPQLEYLDVKNSHLVSDESLAYLLVKNPNDFKGNTLSTVAECSWKKNLCCSQLVYLGISGTEVTSRGVLLSLMLVPHLRSFGGYVHDCLLIDVIHQLQKYNITTSLNLTHIWECKIIPGHADIISVFCPFLKYLSTVGSSISSVHFFQHLQALVIDCDFKNLESTIFDILEIIGYQLNTLVIKDSDNTKLNFEYLLDYAPNLLELDAYLRWVDCTDLPQKNFEKLYKASICVNSSNCLERFLLCSPSINCLMISFKFEPYSDTTDSICDALIVGVLKERGLQYLKHFHIETCEFGDYALEQLLLNCPLLCCVQGILFWHKLTQTFLDKLKTQITFNNWDVCLIPHGNECNSCNI